MGKEDIQSMNYLNDARRFADMVNGSLFHGKNIIDAKDLQEADKEVFSLLKCAQNKQSLKKTTCREQGRLLQYR